MFKFLSKTLLSGFIAILPVVLTVYLLYWLGVSSETVMGNALRYILPENTYFPGLGMIAGVTVVFIVGLMMNAYLVRKLFSFGEELLYRLPLIKSIYRAFRDFFDFFKPNKEGLGQVVAVTINGMELVGFITQEDPQRLPPRIGEGAPGRTEARTFCTWSSPGRILDLASSVFSRAWV